MSTVETHQFQTEARQLLDLMIHSVYSHKDIFLRELISNSSDALDKRRFAAVQDPALLPDNMELEIRIERDPEQRQLTVWDNGIGMSRDEVKELIGTIAKSGTREFTQKLREAQKAENLPQLIGQFGVGFYSTFMVADRVTLITRKAGEESATRWESTGDGTYTLEEATRDVPGTTVTLHLQEADPENGLPDFTEEWQIREVVKRYSDFVAYPIRMEIERVEVERDEEGKPVEGGKEEKVTKLETLNSMKALWLRSKDEVSEDEYNEFYRHISHDWTDPLARIQARIEGTLEYTMLLYIPSQAPMDLFQPDSAHRGVQLYVKRVFIMDDCTELLPEYLRFVRGVVDSEDLPLNISREILQQNRQIRRMSKGVVSKVLGTLKEMKDKEPEKYLKFWGEFGRVLKEGLIHDQENRETIFELCRFASTMSDGGETTLQEYIDRMKADQDVIYYMTGDSRERVENSPHLEVFKDKGYEVLILTEPVDAIWTQFGGEFQGKQFKSVGKGAVDLGGDAEKGEEEEQRKQQEKDLEGLLKALQQQLSEHVKEVRLSKRLTSSAACLVSDSADLTPQLERMMKQMGQQIPASKRILEVNAQHPVLKKLEELHGQDGKEAELKEYAQLLHGQALLAEGGELPDPAGFSRLVSELMVKAL